MKDLHDVALVGLLAIFVLTIVTHTDSTGTHSNFVTSLYLVGMMACMIAYGYLTQHPFAIGIGWAMAAINLLILSIEGLKILGQSFLRQSLIGLLVGLFSLVVGLAISFRKSERYSRQPLSPIPDGPSVIKDSPREPIPPSDPTVS